MSKKNSISTIVLKAQSGDDRAIRRIKERFIIQISRYAEKISNEYGLEEVPELVAKGDAGLNEAIMHYGDAVKYNFYVYANNIILQKMYAKWRDVKRAITKVEKIYGRKYSSADDDMTEDIINELKSSIDENKVRESLYRCYPLSYYDMKGVKMLDTETGRDNKMDSVIKVWFSLSPKKMAIMRLKYGIFPKKTLSDDEISSCLMIPIEKLEEIRRKKLNGKVLNSCEKRILDLKKGIVDNKVFVSDKDIQEFYNLTLTRVSELLHDGVQKIRSALNNGEQIQERNPRGKTRKR